MSDIEVEINEIMEKMSIDDKLKLLAQSGNQYGAIPSLDFEGVVPQDVPRGGEDNWTTGKAIRDESGNIIDGKYHPVSYPSNSALAMSFDKDLLYHVGSQFAKEARGNPNKVHILNRPAMNLKRSPRCGRNYDYFSEDHVLTGLLAEQYIRGLQDNGIFACPKHFIANTQEYDRMNTNEIIDERTLNEVYLKTWKLALKAKPEMIMTSYNKVNGAWVNSNSSLMKALRKDLNYEGIVVSDFLAVQNDKVKAHKCSMDIELAQTEVHIDEIKKAYENGEFTLEELNLLVKRILAFTLKAKKSYKKYEIDENEAEAMREDAIKVSENCIALLKNDAILPIENNSRKKILIAGLLAKEPVTAGSGSGFMNGYKDENPFEELKKQGFDLEYAQGYEVSNSRPPCEIKENESLIAEAREKAKKADIVIAFTGSSLAYESESYDRPNIHLPKAQEALLTALEEVSNNVIICLTSGSVYEIAEWAGKAKAIIYSGFCGEGYSKAITNIITGKAEAGGRTAETFPICEEHTPSYLNFTPSFYEMATVNYGEGIFTGYRWYEKRKLPVLFPFGHGLSYTNFEYSSFSIDKAEMTADDTCTVSLKIKNTGKRKGSQVIQLYIKEKGGKYIRPEKELKDFTKVHLEGGEEKTISFKISRESLELYSDTLHKWGVQADDYEIILALSSENIIKTANLKIVKADKMSIYTKMTPLVKFLENPAFQNYLKEKKNEWLQNFFNLEKTDFLVLMLPLPFHRLAEKSQGEAMFTEKEIEEIIEACNNN
ncbi:MAG: glycoside hydrolase family 3 C-terminal domain-containing protein [Treponema sp.]|nr:glycoside hydrolase family 3 C-terminal domain-containing protein [Treponema sp.]